MTLERGNAFTPVASATMIWPWGTSVAAGAITGGLSLLGTWSLSPAIITGIFFFSLVGGAVAVVRKKGDRRAHRYAGQYPWRFAMAPAAVGGAGTALVTFIAAVLSGSIIGGLFGAIGAGIGTAAILWVILGIIGTVAGNKG